MSAHLTKAQHKARGPLSELNLICTEGINLGPYHSGPNPEIRTMAKGTALERLLSGRLNVD